MSGAQLNYTLLGVTWNKSDFQKYACNFTAPKITALHRAALPAWIRGRIQPRHSSLSQQRVWEGECLKEVVLLPCQGMLHSSVGAVSSVTQVTALLSRDCRVLWITDVVVAGWALRVMITCTWSWWSPGFAVPEQPSAILGYAFAERGISAQVCNSEILGQIFLSSALSLSSFQTWCVSAGTQMGSHCCVHGGLYKAEGGAPGLCFWPCHYIAWSRPLTFS